MTERKRMLFTHLTFSLVCFTGILIMTLLWQRYCQTAAFSQVSAFCQILLDRNPEAGDLVFSSLKEYTALPPQETSSSEILARYGYEAADFGAGSGLSFWLPAITISVLLFTFFLLFRLSDQHKKSGIQQLTQYLESINTNSPGILIPSVEDDFSRLQDEIYKTVTNLYTTRESALKAKKNFACNLENIAHQLKTPITAALLSLQLMEPANRHGNAVRKQLEHLNRLEECLLTLSKIDSGTLRLEKKPVDVYTVLNLAADNISDLLEERKAAVSIPDNGPAQFSGDLEWTMEAIINLMKNCMEHSPRNGTISCSYSQNALYTEIVIRDEGPGFDPQDLPHLFQRFYTGKGSSGYGIGLSLSRAIFELQGGNLTACNLAEGGACFEIRLYSH